MRGSEFIKIITTKEGDVITVEKFTKETAEGEWVPYVEDFESPKGMIDTRRLMHESQRVDMRQRREKQIAFVAEKAAKEKLEKEKAEKDKKDKKVK